MTYIRLLLAVSVALTLLGCVPITSTYIRVDAPDARRFGSDCHGSSGPQSVVYYPFHEVYISFDMNPWIRLGLHIPDGVTAQMNGNEVRILGRTENGSIDFSARIKAVSRGALGSVNPPEFKALPDPYLSPDDYGPFRGASKGENHIWHLYVAEDDQSPPQLILAPDGLIDGTIELPSMTINGKTHVPQKLQFKRQRYTGMAVANC